MVGEGVLIECLNSPYIGSVLCINRKPNGYNHQKLREIIHQDFFDLSSIEPQLSGYDACFFCMGVTSVGKKEDEYTTLTYTLTMHAARTLVRLNPGMTFCYISGAGTDSSEKGRLMWARVKGKTENDLMKLPFRKVYAFRPGFLRPTQGQKFALPYYRYVNWLFPLLKRIPGMATTLSELGLAMIYATVKGYEKSIIEVKDIILLNRK